MVHIVGFVVISLLALLGLSLPEAAYGVVLTGESADLGTLLVRTDMSAENGFFADLCKGERANTQCVPPVKFTFNNAPPPASDGVLTVVAAGDVGHVPGAEDRDANDIVIVYSGALAVISAQLYAQTGSTCPTGETGGKVNGVVCGPNFHSVSDPGDLLRDTFGAGGAANGTDFTTDMLPAEQRGDSITIPRDTLANLIVGGTITIFLWPDPGQRGNSGVADIKYTSAELTYAAPEPSTFALVALGLGLLGYRGIRATLGRRSED
jgi:PEP-CTERM motif